MSQAKAWSRGICIFALCVSAILPAAARAAPETVANVGGAGSYSLNDIAAFYSDPSRTLTYSEIDRLPPQAGNKHGGLGAAYWARVPILNQNPAQVHWTAWLSATNLLKVDFYLVDPRTHSVLHGQAGNAVAPQERPIPTRNPAISLDLPAGQLRVLYVRIEALEPAQFNIMLTLSNEFRSSAMKWNFWYAIPFGLALCLFFLFTYSALTLRVRTFGLYVPWIVSLFLLDYSMSGFGDLVTPLQGDPWVHFTPIFLAGMLISPTIFTRSFFETRRNYPRIDRLFRMLVCLFAVNLVAILIWPRIDALHVAQRASALILVAPVLWVAASAWRRGYPAAGYYFLAWVSPLLVLPIWLAIWQGWWKTGVFPTNFMVPFLSLELVIMSFAVTDRFIRMRNELNQQLEQGVRERTRELREEIVERKRAEHTIIEQQAKLMAASRMTVLGEMAGGLAHEINTPLGSILLGFQLLKRIFEKGRATPEILDRQFGQIEAAIQRITRIISGLKAFAREPDDRPPEVLSLKRIFSDAFVLCSARFKNRGITLAVDPLLADWPDTWRVRGNAQDLTNVIIHLLNNSLDAVADLQQSWVGVEVRQVKNAGAVGEFFEIAVVDSGRPIPSEVAEKIMQPFFSTKGLGHGVGLGLATSKGIVENHGGKLWLDRSSPRTRFVFMLPSEAATGPTEVNYERVS